MSVDISGLDKVELLRALWTRMAPAAFFSFNPSVKPPHFDEAQAQKAVLSYVDYFCGRCIKADLRSNTASPHLYDRDAGDGAFASVVAALRA